SGGRYRGVAPKALIVSVRVIDQSGAGKTSDAIAGLEWVLNNRAKYGIRVVNLSFGHPINEPAMFDPLVQAVERTCQSGVAVVCSAGDLGRSGRFTITSPGNSVRAITVGRLTDWNPSVRLDGRA